MVGTKLTVPDLGQKMLQSLEQNEVEVVCPSVDMNQCLDIISKNSKLTWHGGMIPAHEIWVKIGGVRTFQNVLPDLQRPTSQLC